MVGSIVSRLEYVRDLLASIAPLIDDEATKELAEKINEATKLAERDECRARGEPHLKLVDQ
jgi:hypothetical protein